MAGSVAGAALGVLAAALLDAPLRQRLATASAHLESRDERRRELAAVKAQVDAFQAAKERFASQVRWIEEERARQRCPGLVLARLPLGKASPIERVMVSESALVLVGRAPSDRAVVSLAEAVEQSTNARPLRAGAERGTAGPDGRVRFGLLATIEAPHCREPDPHVGTLDGR